MGDLRQNGADAQGAWLRVNGAGMGRQGSFDNRYTHYEIGYDQLYRDDGQGRSFEGFSLSYAEGRSSYQRGSGENHNENISFYRVDQRNTGHYLDLVCRIGFYANSFSVADSMLNKISGRTDSYGISANVEYGRKNSLKHGWYLEPQAQLTIGHISSSQYSTSNGVDVHQGGMNSLVGRAGLNIGKSFGKERRGSIYLKANLLREFLGSYGIDMSTGGTQRSARGSYRDNWFEYGLGFAWQYGKNAHIYADVERSAGSSYYKNWAWNVGLRWTFN